MRRQSHVTVLPGKLWSTVISKSKRKGCIMRVNDPDTIWTKRILQNSNLWFFSLNPIKAGGTGEWPASSLSLNYSIILQKKLPYNRKSQFLHVKISSKCMFLLEIILDTLMISQKCYFQSLNCYFTVHSRNRLSCSLSLINIRATR